MSGVSEPGGASPRQIRRVGRADEGAAAEVLARAFRDGPITCAVVGKDPARRLRSNRHGMRQSLRGIRADGLALSLSEKSDRSPQGVLVALPPGAFPLDPPRLRSQVHSVLAQGLGAAARWGDVYRALEVVHPWEPHWYLSLLGVEPAWQGRGVGRGLLDAWLADVDAEGHPSYLETDREANLAFYGAAGFVLREEVDVLGVRIFCLWREARAADPPGPVLLT